MYLGEWHKVNYKSDQEYTQSKKTADISRHHHWFPREITSWKRAQEFHTDDASLPDLGSASDWLKQIQLATRPIRSITQIWVVSCHQHGISALVSMSHFAEKPVVASRNVGCFSRLEYQYTLSYYFVLRPLSFSPSYTPINLLLLLLETLRSP